MLQGQDVPRSIRTQVDESSGVGIATASFNSEDITLFVLGAEVGGMFLCSTAREVCFSIFLNFTFLFSSLQGLTGVHQKTVGGTPLCNNNIN